LLAFIIRIYHNTRSSECQSPLLDWKVINGRTYGYICI